MGTIIYGKENGGLANDNMQPRIKEKNKSKYVMFK